MPPRSWPRRAASPLAFAAVALATTGVPAAARADDRVLVGIFEGHPIAPPADPARARAAVVAARRLHSECISRYVQRWGGPGESRSTCEPATSDLAALGRDAAAALLDVAEVPATVTTFATPHATLSAVLTALAATKREDLVPVLFTARERVKRRIAAGEKDLEDVDVHLERTLVLMSGVGEWEWRAPDFSWEAWWRANEGKDVATWQREALERTRAAARSRVGDAAAAPALELAQRPATRAEGRKILEQLRTSPACANGACPSVEGYFAVERMEAERRAYEAAEAAKRH